MLVLLIAYNTLQYGKTVSPMDQFVITFYAKSCVNQNDIMEKRKSRGEAGEFGGEASPLPPVEIKPSIGALFIHHE